MHPVPVYRSLTGRYLVSVVPDVFNTAHRRVPDAQLGTFPGALSSCTQIRMEYSMPRYARRFATFLVAGITILIGFAASPASAAATPHLSYYGGHVLSHVKVDLVVWDRWSYGRSVPLSGTRSMSSFFRGVTASKYLDWLSEYDTPTQHIGRGSLEGVYTLHPPSAANGSTVSGTQIESALHSLIDTGRLPKPSTDRVYAIFFRSGQTIVTPDGNSTNNFCAYHDTMTYKSSTAYYAVLPYEVTNRGCRMASTYFNSTTTIVSHELVEAITDPGVGLNRVAWYDRANGESADICAGASSAVSIVGGDGVSYTVQRIWSNRARACIVAR